MSESWRINSLGTMPTIKKLVQDGEINCRALYVIVLMSNCPEINCDWVTGWTIKQICGQYDIGSGPQDWPKFEAANTVIRLRYDDDPSKVTFVYIKRETSSILIGREKHKTGNLCSGKCYLRFC